MSQRESWAIWREKKRAGRRRGERGSVTQSVRAKGFLINFDMKEAQLAKLAGRKGRERERGKWLKLIYFHVKRRKEGVENCLIFQQKGRLPLRWG